MVEDVRAVADERRRGERAAVQGGVALRRVYQVAIHAAVRQQAAEALEARVAAIAALRAVYAAAAASEEAVVVLREVYAVVLDRNIHVHRGRKRYGGQLHSNTCSSSVHLRV